MSGNTQEIQDLIEITREAAKLEQERIAELKALREDFKGWRLVGQRIEWVMWKLSGIEAAFASLVELIGMALGQDKTTKERVQKILEEQASKVGNAPGLTIKAGGDVEIGGDVHEDRCG